MACMSDTVRALIETPAAVRTGITLDAHCDPYGLQRNGLR